MAKNHYSKYIANMGFCLTKQIVHTATVLMHNMLQKRCYKTKAVALLAVLFLSGMMGPVHAKGAREGTGSVEIMLTGLDDARSVRTSTLGNIFIVESGRHRILKVDKHGARLDSLGRLGNGDYQFDLPVAIDPANELKIYIADRNNRRIQVFDRRFQYLSTIKMPQRAGLATRYRPLKLTVDPVGDIYFFDEDRHVVYRFDSNGHYELEFELFSEEERIIPVSMTILDDELWVAGQRGELLHRFTTRGSYVGFIYTPEPVRAVRSHRGNLWLLGSENVFQIDHTGRVITSISLPVMPQQERRRGVVRQRRNAAWHSFDVRDNILYLLNAGMLVKVKLEA